MPRTCVECGKTSNRFTHIEYRSREPVCKDCEKGVAICVECKREFFGNSRLNQLKMHMQTHQDRLLACPACNSQKRYRTGAGVAAHFESGHCSSCPNRDQALHTIHRLVQNTAPQFMSDRLMIEDAHDGSVPKNSYACNHCSKRFNLMSALMQHQSSTGHGDAASTRLSIVGF